MGRVIVSDSGQLLLLSMKFEYFFALFFLACDATEVIGVGMS